MNTCAVKQVETLQAADHICIWDKSRWPFRYTHHGIVYTEGNTSDDIVIAHVWSAIDGFRESQADSSFRQTSLTEFLNGRPVSDMRRVQYNSSFLGNVFSKLGEVHYSKSDIPPIVLARCHFLMGLGKGHFNILSLNCEHVALWCKTGDVWSKQLFHKVHTRVPFVSTKRCHQALATMEQQLATLRDEYRARNQALCALQTRRVYLQVGDSGTKFVKRLGRSRSLYVVHNDPLESDLAFRQSPTAFRLQVIAVRDNYVKVVVSDALTSEALCSKAKCVKLVQPQPYHRDTLFEFEFGWNGELQSRRNRRWYIGAQTRDGLLRTFSSRDKAVSFRFVDADAVDAQSVAIDISDGSVTTRPVSVDIPPVPGPTATVQATGHEPLGMLQKPEKHEQETVLQMHDELAAEPVEVVA